MRYIGAIRGLPMSILAFLVLFLPTTAAAPGAIRLGGGVEVFHRAALEFGVPEEILLALAFEASHFQPAVESEWGGYGLFDLREGQTEPALEHAAALIETNPNGMIRDWRLQVRGAAALLADEARLANGGILPSAADLPAWWPAVSAFSGRQEPFLQDAYARGIYDVVTTGFAFQTPLGQMALLPQAVDLVDHAFPPPPPATMDYAAAERWYAACDENFSDYSRGSGEIDMVVIHTVQGSYAGCYSWFANCTSGASAQYVVQSSGGAVTQMVLEEDVAWHAGNWSVNERSVGIEHEGYVSDCSYYTDAMYASSARLTADIASRQGVPLDRTHIIGHNEVPDPYNAGQYGGAGHHTDPGPCWDWDYYMGLLGGESGASGGQIIGVVADSDIQNGTRLLGANVWIEQNGEATTVASDGFYRFEDQPWDTYTMHATYPGYAEGTCTKTTTGSQDWCSIALFPDDGPDADTDVDSGSDTDAVDTGARTDPDGNRGHSPNGPGKLVEWASAGGGCDVVGMMALWSTLLAAPLVLRRRRK